MADFALETRHEGIVCGIDEAGRAPLAGPVSAACVHVPEEKRDLPFWPSVRDSKKLSARMRDTLFDEIVAHCPHGIAFAEAHEIDAINIHHASHLAMTRAYRAMCRDFRIVPAMALVDGKFLPKKDIDCAMLAVIGGDDISRSIAAASILAKVTRDRLMQELHEAYPAYGWDRNAGYPTAIHRNALSEHGPTPHHRQSFIRGKPYVRVQIP